MLGRSEYLKLAPDKSDKPASPGWAGPQASLRHIREACAGPEASLGQLGWTLLAWLLVELKLVYGGLGSRTEGAGLWLGWA